MRSLHIPKERIAVLGQDPKLERLEWRRRCFTTDPSKDKEAENAKDKDMIEEPYQNKNMPLKQPITVNPKDSGLGETRPPGFGLKETTTSGTEIQDPMETPPLSTETQALVDPVTPTPLSTKVPKHEIPEEAIPLSEYSLIAVNWP